MSRATTGNDKNVCTKIVPTIFENNLCPEEVSGKRVWRSYGFLDARKSDNSLEG